MNIAAKMLKVFVGIQAAFDIMRPGFLNGSKIKKIHVFSLP